MTLKMADYIVTEARAILSGEEVVFPAPMTSALGFYVAKETDNTILAFAALLHNGTYFKIGVLRHTHYT